MRLWIEYDDTPERLPIRITENISEMSRLSGATRKTIRSSAYKMREGKTKTSRFAFVDIMEEQND